MRDGHWQAGGQADGGDMIPPGEDARGFDEVCLFLSGWRLFAMPAGVFDGEGRGENHLLFSFAFFSSAEKGCMAAAVRLDASRRMSGSWRDWQGKGGCETSALRISRCRCVMGGSDFCC